MRYLSAVTTPTIASRIERGIGHGRLRPLKANDDLRSMGGERFAGIIADHAAQLPLLRLGLPVILLVPLNREGMRQFRIVAEDGIDVRLWADGDDALSEMALQALSGPRSPSPAAAIVDHLRGRYSDLVADVLTACAILATSRRSMDEIARVCGASPSSVRGALRDAGLASISGVIARMRCLHALWAWESGRQNFWSHAGFRTLAELSAHLSQHTGSPLGRWKAQDGFQSLLQSIGSSLSQQDEETAQVG